MVGGGGLSLRGKVVGKVCLGIGKEEKVEPLVHTDKTDSFLIIM